MIGRIIALGLPALAACQAVPTDVDVAPVDDPRDRGTLAVEFEICQPVSRVSLQTIDVDISSYLAALDKSFDQVPADRRDMRLKSGLPAMSPPGHMAVRYAGASLTAIDRLWQSNEVLEEHKDGAISVFSVGPALDGGLLDLTVSQQPVFHFWVPRYDEITGISASSVTSDRGYEKYCFVPPPAATVPAKGFTAWQPPSSVETPAWHMTHANWSPATWDARNSGRGVPITDTTKVPRIRYHLVAEREAWRLDEPWEALRRWLPSLIERQYSVKVASSEPTARGQDNLIRPRDAAIAACD